ncbi:hypothetical protein DUNSADRAFT_8491 [Dunaliella salina]|uniref:Encoded protein n=1 Tax=Dunaliella salina TaxID=3046 RepID=A0ABQ7GJD5_DUNSA|nr:hypothetical protein DUNSADRAFT_8491 [Dunaliella salina]|eukprot:KAF5834721.1 hypothetical protein DUNSADRAFT_8491 [Dunaliella salina]
MSQEWPNQVVQIFPLENHEARRSSAGNPAGSAYGKGVDHDESVGRGRSSQGSSCLGLDSWGNKSSLTQSEQDRSAHGPPALSAPTCVGSGQGEDDALASAPSVFLVGKLEGSDRLTPLQQVKKAISAASNAFIKVGSWSSRARERERAISFDIPPSATAPPRQDKALALPDPIHSQPPLSPSIGSSARPSHISQGLSRNLNGRMPPSCSDERNVQFQQLKPCSSRSMDRTLIKRVSFFFSLESADVAGGGPAELDACSRSSDHRPSSTCPSEGTPSSSSGPRSSDPPLASPDCSTRSSGARSRSSASTYFFQGTLGHMRRGSTSDEALPTLEHSEAGDGDAAHRENQRVAGKEGSRLEFYQFVV